MSRGCACGGLLNDFEQLEERISEGAYQNLIAQLPQGIGEYRDASDIDQRRTGERFRLDEFLERVARREGVRKQEAAFHARVWSVARTATSASPRDKRRARCCT